MKTTTRNILAAAISIGFVAACGNSGSDESITQTPAAIEITPASWQAGRIGQRQQFTATVLDTNGKPIPGQTTTWVSGDESIAGVDGTGMTTALAVGVSEVTAFSGGLSASASVAVTSEVPSATGDMYTLWPARSDDSPVLLINGRLKFLNDMYCQQIVTEGQNHWVTIICPDPLPVGLPSDSLLNNKPTDSLAKIPWPTSPWTQGGIVKFQWAGDTIGILSDMHEGRGTFRARARHDEWTVLALANASDFMLEGNRIGVLVNDGMLRVKDGVHGTWRNLALSGVSKFQLEGNRIALLTDEGGFRAKDGLDGTWRELAFGGTRDFQLKGNRIAMLTDDGLFRVKEGLDGTWTDLASGGIKAFQLEGNRIAVWRDDGHFFVKDGINGAWRELATSGVRDFQLEGNRIAILYDDGLLRAKDGIDGAMINLANIGSSTLFQLQENFIGVVREDGALAVKEGLNGAWRVISVPGGASATQLRLVVDVPAPPVRTTPDKPEGAADYWWTSEIKDYQHGQLVCDLNQPVDCVSPIIDAIAPWYGRFCGDDRPSEEDWNAAKSAGPIDSMDYICLNHDRNTEWYPAEDPTSTKACIVRYGFAHEQWTRNGSRVAEPTAAFFEIRNRMPNLAEATDLYKQKVDSPTCSDSELEEFTANSAAKHNR